MSELGLYLALQAAERLTWRGEDVGAAVGFVSRQRGLDVGELRQLLRA